MRLVLLALFAAGLAFSPAWGEAAAADAALIEKVEARFAQVKTIKARFTQEFFDAATGQTLRSGGTLLLKKPLKMLWRYAAPEEQSILSDGKRLYMHVPAQRQVIVQPLANALNSRSPALFLAGGRRLQEIFRVAVVPRGNDSKMNEAALSLEPKEESLTVTRIIIRFSTDDYTIRSFTLHDWTGNRSTVAFADMEVNGPVADAAFAFKRPAGTELIEAPKY